MCVAISLTDIKKHPAKEKYINRELSWLKFNMRVLEEAGNANHPLLERVNFLSISGSNLDEFYMVRVAGIKGQITSGLTIKSDDGLSPQKQLELINSEAAELIKTQQSCWETIVDELKAEGISVLSPEDVNDGDRDWLEQYFLSDVFPVLTPMAVDPAHPFPFIPNLRLPPSRSRSRDGETQPMQALIPIPHQVKRFIRLPGDGIRFLSLENLILLFMDMLFPNHTLEGHGQFRVLRDSDIEIEEEARDLMRQFESALRRRRRGRVIRLKLNSAMPDALKKMVIKEFEANEQSVVTVDGILGIEDINQLIIKDRDDLLFEVYNPRFPERVKEFAGNVFDAIKDKDFIVHHPYESFDVVHNFLAQAASDPDVVAIKQTLYRAGSQSPIIKALIAAAENGKSVTALIELKARFDEEQNIKWARDLERAGVHVVYGFLDMKTHAKVSMVVRREDGNLQSYVHFGTGNYHPITARVYTDLSFFTADPALGRDAAKLFNYVTGYVEPQSLEKIALSPKGLKNKVIELIDHEIVNAKAGKPAAIWAKMNALVEIEVIDKLYEASAAGVEIDLVVRGVCCLRPQVKGLSENIRVKSIVGRFLEHARIYCFANGKELPSDEALVYIASADWMPRNFDYRVEDMVPIENPTVHRQVLHQVMVANLKDNAQSWVMCENGHYERCHANGAAFSAHEYFMTNPSLSGRGDALDDTSPKKLKFVRPHSGSTSGGNEPC